MPAPSSSDPMTPEGKQTPPTLTDEPSGISTSTNIYDKSLLIADSKAVEKELGDKFMQALHHLDTAFNLPDAVRNLSKGLRDWREEVELLFPGREVKQRKPSTLPPPTTASSGAKDDAASAGKPPDPSKPGIGLRLIKRTRPHLGVRSVSKRGALVDNHTWHGFLEASKMLSRNLLIFLSALHYLSEFQRTWCAIATGELMVTLEEMCSALGFILEDESSRSNDASRKPTEKSDIRTFVAVRLVVCQIQLKNLFEAMDDYERNEINHIRLIQNREFDGLRNVTTVSTFFAGVIASTLQFSLTADQSVPFIIINAFWLSALVFSIGSALNSFLGLAMRKLASLTPLNKQPRAIKFWIKRSELTLLVISIISYGVGLAVYVINSQHSVVSIVTCVGAACCSIGIAIVWLHQLLERFLHHRRRRRSSSDPSSDEEGQSATGDTNTKVLKENSPSHDDHKDNNPPKELIIGSSNHALVKIGDSHDIMKIGPVTSPSTALNREKTVDFVGGGRGISAGVVAHERDADKPRTLDYATLLQHLRRVRRADNLKLPPSHFKRGEIAHMRCSPDGRWVAICHHHACMVYDLENATIPTVLLADDDKRSAEHAEWAQEGSVLLTRTDKELRVWKLTVTDSNPCQWELEKRYSLQTGLCKYVKWLSRREFLILSDHGTLYRVNHENQMEGAALLTLPEFKGYAVEQVYPLVAEEVEWILCSGSQEANLPQDILDDFEVEAGGVDYILALQLQKQIEKSSPSDHSTSRPGIHGMHLLPLFNKTQVQPRYSYKIRLRKILPRNIRNLKFCKYHEYVLVNYDVNEAGTTAPELWKLNFDYQGADSWTFDKIDIAVLQAPQRPDQKEESKSWGEASFAGPAHDIVVCEVNGVITFFKFDRSKGPSSLEYLHALVDDRAPDFGDFFHPIFTWGDTVAYPLMVATDLDGKGEISVWNTRDQNVESTAGSTNNTTGGAQEAANP